MKSAMGALDGTTEWNGSCLAKMQISFSLPYLIESTLFAKILRFFLLALSKYWNGILKIWKLPCWWSCGRKIVKGRSKSDMRQSASHVIGVITIYSGNARYSLFRSNKCLWYENSCWLNIGYFALFEQKWETLPSKGVKLEKRLQPIMSIEMLLFSETHREFDFIPCI